MPDNFNNIKNIHRGDKKISASNFNQIVAAARQKFIGSAGININQVGNNLKISLDHKYVENGWWLGRINETADGAPTYSDYHYVVSRIEIDSSDTVSDLTFTQRTPPYSDTVTVTNLVEINDGTHLLSDTQEVIVFELKDESIPPVRQYLISHPVQPDFWARIGSNASDSSNRYNYAWTEVYKETAGYGGWSTKVGGRSGSLPSSDVARNTIEDMNTGSDIMGNGVASDSMDTSKYTYTLQPAPSGVIVRMYSVVRSDSTEKWFSYVNGVDGACI